MEDLFQVDKGHAKSAIPGGAGSRLAGSGRRGPPRLRRPAGPAHIRLRRLQQRARASTTARTGTTPDGSTRGPDRSWSGPRVLALGARLNSRRREELDLLAPHPSPASPPVVRACRLGAAVVLSAALAGCDAHVRDRLDVLDDIRAAARLPSPPSVPADDEPPVDRVVTASAAHPQLAVQGVAVQVQLPTGQVLATVTGPHVPPFVAPPPPTVTATFDVSMAQPAGDIPISAGRLHHHRPARSQLPSRAWLQHETPPPPMLARGHDDDVQGHRRHADRRRSDLLVSDSAATRSSAGTSSSRTTDGQVRSGFVAVRCDNDWHTVLGFGAASRALDAPARSGTAAVGVGFHRSRRQGRRPFSSGLTGVATVRRGVLRVDQVDGT